MCQGKHIHKILKVIRGGKTVSIGRSKAEFPAAGNTQRGQALRTAIFLPDLCRFLRQLLAHLICLFHPALIES